MYRPNKQLPSFRLMFSCMEEGPGFFGLDKDACGEESGWGSPEQVLVPEEVTEDLGSFLCSVVTLPPPRASCSCSRQDKRGRMRPAEIVPWTVHPVSFALICNQPALISMATSNHKEIWKRGGFLTGYFAIPNRIEFS